MTRMRSLSSKKLYIYLASYDRGSDQNGVKKPEHWAIFIAESLNDADGHEFQIIHGHPVFAYSYRDHTVMQGWSRSTCGKKSPIIIGKVKANKIAKIDEAFAGIPVVNDDPNWNCQNWTQDAIRVLESMGYIAKGTADDSVRWIARLRVQTRISRPG
ncbi:hypothetical protein F5888DRAFT_1659547 [Russula emetica]|nr:hypothetical protein F5888DRAFT_1659547 [Russula emetica]